MTTLKGQNMFNSEDERVCAFCGLSKQLFEDLKDQIAELEEQRRRYHSVLNQVLEEKSRKEGDG